MSVRGDFTGKRFARLLVIRKFDRTHWLCECDCGTICTPHKDGLRGGVTKSCGCYRREMVAARNKTHGYAGTKIYKCWRGIMSRCYSPNRKNFKYYGGRGIRVCKRWHKFENFLADMGEVPEGKSIDRYPDNNGNYEPDNCRWATPEQQIHNRRPRSEWKQKGPQPHL